jgi:hypothetical protein
MAERGMEAVAKAHADRTAGTAHAGKGAAIVRRCQPRLGTGRLAETPFIPHGEGRAGEPERRRGRGRGRPAGPSGRFGPVEGADSGIVLGAYE